MPACRIDRSIYPSRPVTLARASVCIHPPILGPRPPSIDVSLPYPHPTTQPTTPHTTTAPPPPSPSAGRRSWPRTPAQSRPCRRASGTALRRSFPGTSSTTTSGCVRFRLCVCVCGANPLGRSIDRPARPVDAGVRPAGRSRWTAATHKTHFNLQHPQHINTSVLHRVRRGGGRAHPARDHLAGLPVARQVRLPLHPAGK